MFPRSLILIGIAYCVYVVILVIKYNNRNKQPKEKPKKSKPYRIPHNFFTLLRRKKEGDKELIQSLKKGNEPTYRKQGDTRTKEEIQKAIDESVGKPQDWKEKWK